MSAFMKAPFTRFPIFIFCLAIIISPIGKAQAEQIGFEVRIGQGTEAVHFPLQHNPIGEGKITRVPSSLTFEITVTSGEPKQFSACPHFLAVVGPAGHPLLGDRFELDEVATRALSGNQLVLEPSPLNTDPLVDSRWIGAEFEVIPHWTLQDTLSEMIRRKLTSPLPRPAPTLWMPFGERVPQKIVPRMTAGPQSRLCWVADNKKILSGAKTVLPPGSSFLIKSACTNGYGFSLGGDRRMAPCRVPLLAGPNLVGYPYPVDLRLGIDWGGQADGLVPSQSPKECDQIFLYSGKDLQIYGFHISYGWLPILGLGSEGVRWDTSSPRLEVIPAGCGFVVFKMKPDSKHIFQPPQT